MNTSQKYFLLVAEELCMTSASQKLFVSPQSISSHIKHLEQAYGVQLFTRRPKLTLTPEGKALYDSLRKIQLIETNISEQLSNTGKGLSGTVKFGIDASRGKMLLREVYGPFHEKYPNIVLEMATGYTPDLIPQILSGALHFMFGAYWDNFPELAVTNLQEEQYQYVVSDRLLQKYYGAGWKQLKETLSEGVLMKDVDEIPLILTTEASYMHKQLTRLFQEHAVFPKVQFCSNIHSSNIEMAASGFGACFCPSMLVDALVPSAVGYLGQENDLCAYPLKNFRESHAISLVYRNDIYIPPYVKTFMDYLTMKYRQ